MTNLLEEILDLIQKRPSADDPTGLATRTALTAWIEIHDIAGRQISTHTVTLTPLPCLLYTSPSPRDRG